MNESSLLDCSFNFWNFIIKLTILIIIVLSFNAPIHPQMDTSIKQIDITTMSVAGATKC